MADLLYLDSFISAKIYHALRRHPVNKGCLCSQSFRLQEEHRDALHHGFGVEVFPAAETYVVLSQHEGRIIITF